MSNCKPADAYEVLMNQFEEQCKKAGMDNYLIDGPIDPDVYWQQEEKICIIGLETYGYGNCGKVAIATCYGDWMKANIRTTRFTSVFTSVLLEKIDAARCGAAPAGFDRSAMCARYKDFDRLVADFKRVAFLNIRKTSNETTAQNKRSIEEEGTARSPHIKQQLELLMPSIIVTLGVSAHKIMFDVAKPFDISSKTSTIRFHSVVPVKGRVVAAMQHSSRQSYHYMYERATKVAAEIAQIAGVRSEDRSAIPVAP